VKVRRIAWVGIRTDEYDATVRLFRDVIGLPVEFAEAATTELSAGDDRVQIFAPGHRYHGFFGEHASGPVPLFEVDDLRAAQQKLEETGIRLVGSIERDANWEWLNFRGPDGNLYELASRRG
jgi:catechol 2,3-dioxygenase-like lactoylglutathione lyase family enzyme